LKVEGQLPHTHTIIFNPAAYLLDFLLFYKIKDAELKKLSTFNL
jgi:hypothetical protein